MSLLELDHNPENFIDAAKALRARVADLERYARTGTALTIAMDMGDVSSPPTDAELDAIFGDPDEVGAGFTALVNDGGAGTAEYVVWSDGQNWWYAAGTKAT